MPNLQVCEYVKQSTGVDPANIHRAQNAKSLIVAAERLKAEMGAVLYNAVVRLDGQSHLSGPPLSAAQLIALAEVAELACNQPNCPEAAERYLSDFAGAARRYSALIPKNTREVAPAKGINKQISEAVYEGTHFTPRHALNCVNSEIHELLTWMTKDEIGRVENRFASTHGLFSITAQRSRERKWGEQSLTEYKVTLGCGAFGSASLARRVSSDEYLVLKKAHPKAEGPKPALVPITRGINDGSVPGISRVYASYLGYSTRQAAPQKSEPSAYTLTELGVIDGYRFISVFSTMAYALNPQYINEPLAITIREAMLGQPNPLNTIINATYLNSSPCKDPELVRQFKNTMALQMLKAVQHMHQQDRAHNDIKPDNFVLAYDASGVLRMKLIDFDLNASVKGSVGKVRNAYAEVFSAPQVSSSDVDNRADRNDAYSMGCTIRVLNGEPLQMLGVRRLAAKGIIRDESNHAFKPVEDRRSIETRFAKLPELATLSDLADLLTHPHCGKRYTIAEAIRSPVFTTPGNLMSDREFGQVAEKVIRQSYMLPEEMRTCENLIQLCEYLPNARVGESSNTPMGAMATALTQQDRRLLISRYKQTKGDHQLAKQLDEVSKQLTRDNLAAGVRRGLRLMNVSNYFKSPAQREAGYKYKSPQQ